MTDAAAKPFGGSVALVTGAAGGIGAATAYRLARDGATVACCDISTEGLKSRMEPGRQQGLELIDYTIDVTDAAAVQQLIHSVTADLGGLEIVATIHGVYHQAKEGEGPVEAESLLDWSHVLGVNLMGVVHVTSEALRVMKDRRRGGRIVAIGSIAAVTGGIVAGAAYPVSKAAVACFMKCVAREGAPYGVTANTVAPGHTDTQMGKIVQKRVSVEEIARRTPLARLAEPREIANAVVFLCSHDASFITGEVLAVNGGQLMAPH